jgi:anti-sigma factor RsiW
MSDCERHLEDLALLAADEIDPERRAAVERHLAACPTCTRERATIDRAFAELRAAEVPDPGPVYWSGFEARFRTRLATGRAAIRRRTFYVAAAAALVAALGLGILLGRRPDGGAAVPSGAGVTTVAAGAPGSETAADAAEGERAEARLEAAFHAISSSASGDDEFEAILDEIAPGDPYAFTGAAISETRGSSGV